MLTLSMIVKNEEKYLEDCLLSVQGIVDEIVIVDTGSTDDTIKIAEKYNSKIFHFDWINDFSAARNFALEKSTGNWILYLDADERLKKESYAEIKRLTKSPRNIAYNCLVNNVDNVTSRPVLMSYPRLFPKLKNLKFEGHVHEQIEAALNKNGCKISSSNILIEHIGYSVDKGAIKEKAKRNLNLLLMEYAKEKSSYIAYQLGQTYGILNENENTIKYFKEALKDNKLVKEYRSLCYRFLGIAEAEKLNYNEAVRLLELSIKEYAYQPYSLLALSKIFVQLKDYAKVKDLLKAAYKINKDIINKKIKAAQSSYLAEELLVEDSITTALQINDRELFNYFYPLLKNIGSKKDELKCYDFLINNKILTTELTEKIIEISGKNNLNFIIALLNNYSIEKTKKDIYEKLYVKFKDDINFLIKLGLYYQSIEEYNLSKKVFEEGLQKGSEDLSIIFYLTTTYLKLEQYQNIKELIKYSENKYSGNPGFINKLNIMKQKLKMIL